jgi:hypothetical protein
MLVDEQFVLLIIKPIVIGALAGAAFGWLSRLTSRGGEALGLIGGMLVSIPIVLVSYVAGYLTAVQGSAAVGNLMPAILALIGGFNVYLFGTRIENRPLSIFAIFLFAITLLYGIIEGGYERDQNTLATREAQMRAISDLDLRIRQYRSNLGLPPELPAWATAGQ